MRQKSPGVCPGSVRVIVEYHLLRAKGGLGADTVLCTFLRGMKKVAWSSYEIMSSVWYYEDFPAQFNEANPPIWF